MAKKDQQRGKSLELHVGRIFGGRRRRNGEGVGFDDCVDVNGFQLPISIESKAYSVLQLRTSWVNQAVRNATGRPWIIVQRPKGSHKIFATLELDTLIDPEFHDLIRSLTSAHCKNLHPEEKQCPAPVGTSLRFL